MVWFSNGIANVGANNLQVRMGDLATNLDDTQIEYFKSLGLDPALVRLASQELLDITKNPAVIIPHATLSNYHASHSHLHVAEIAEFGIEQFDVSTNTWNVITGRDVVKQTFCLMDNAGQIRPVANSSDPNHYEIFYEMTHPTQVAWRSCREFQMVQWMSTVLFLMARK